MGGAGNVALNVTSLGGQCTLVAIIGDDSAGTALEQIAVDMGIDHDFIVDSDAPTSIKQRIISRNQQLIRADFEGLPTLKSTRALSGSMEQQLESHDVVVISDYGKGALSDVELLISMARDRNIPVLVDPKGSDFSRYSGATMITPNLKEFEQVVGTLNDDHEMLEKADDTIARYDLDQLLVTLSERGMMLYQSNGLSVHSPARSREVYDVSGAGDTVIAVMAMCISVGLNVEFALSIANSAAGLVVSKLGTATATMTELRQAIERDAVQ